MEHIVNIARFRTSKAVNINHTPDLYLLGTVLIICAFGLLMVYDSSQFEAFQSFGDSYYYIKQQGISFLLGILAMSFFTFFDYHKLQKFALPVLIFSLGLLVLVFVPGLGVSAYGAHRWMKLFGFTIQPAEIIKLTSIIFFASIFRVRTYTKPFLLTTFFVIGVVGIMQKDLGSSVIFAIVALSLYFIAKAPLIHFLGLSLALILSAISAIIFAPYRTLRIMAFIDPFRDPQGFTYHISQVLIALGSGGIFGLGVGQSRQKFAYIPEVTTDSIFAIIGEEFGFVGGAILIFLFAFMVLRGFRTVKGAPDNFGKLLASGISLWLGVQAAVNLASMVALIPLTGVPLPFISYGGSALMVNLIAVGILLNISKQTNPNT